MRVAMMFPHIKTNKVLSLCNQACECTNTISMIVKQSIHSSCIAIQLIVSWETDDSLLHAASWTQTLSMGNLMMISDGYFELLIKVEGVCYESLSSNNLRNCFLTDFLVESCMASQIIRAMWEKLVGHSDKEFILERLVRFFSRTRAQAYVNHLNRQLQVLTSSASLRQSLVSDKKKRNK